MLEAEFLLAAQEGDAAGVRRLLAQDPALVKARGSHGKTALHWAAEKNARELAEVLLEAGAEVEAVTDWGATPLDWAATMGSLDVAQLLMPRSVQKLDLITAAALGMLADVQRLVEAGEITSRRAAPTRPDDHWVADSAHIQGDIISDAFYSACRTGQVEVALYLLSRGADINARGVFGGTGLHWAAHNGHPGMVEFLVSKGADINLQDETFKASPEAWAREGNHHEIAQSLKARRKVPEDDPTQRHDE